MDPVYRFSVTLLTDFGPATLTEADHATALLWQLPTAYPDLHLDTVVGDAAYGYDRDKPGWVSRGYDNRGHPVCTFGYRFTANGFDPAQQRSNWFCGQACLRSNAQVEGRNAVLERWDLKHACPTTGNAAQPCPGGAHRYLGHTHHAGTAVSGGPRRHRRPTSTRDRGCAS